MVFKIFKRFIFIIFNFLIFKKVNLLHLQKNIKVTHTDFENTCQ